MTLHAILIGVTRTDSAPGEAMPAAVPMVRAVEAYLSKRLGVPYAGIRSLPEATRQQVLDTFTEMQPGIGASDTFLVMYIGHGISGNGTDADGWALSGKDAFDDRDLAGWLRQLPAETRKIVISDCCYGLAIAREGPDLAPDSWLLGTVRASLDRLWRSFRLDMTALSRSFFAKVKSHSAVPIPMICIAGASTRAGVTNGGERLLITLTLGTSAGGRTYTHLQADLDEVRAEGSSYFMLIDPADRSGEVVLAG